MGKTNKTKSQLMKCPMIKKKDKKTTIKRIRTSFEKKIKRIN
jgi:hypothetical protein